MILEEKLVKRVISGENLSDKDNKILRKYILKKIKFLKKIRLYVAGGWIDCKTKYGCFTMFLIGTYVCFIKTHSVEEDYITITFPQTPINPKDITDDFI